MKLFALVFCFLFLAYRFCVGDRFYLCENKILCEYDYEERLVFANMAYNPSSLAHIRRQVNSLQVCIIILCAIILCHQFRIFHAAIIISTISIECLHSHTERHSQNYVEVFVLFRLTCAAYAKWTSDANVLTRKRKLKQQQ